MPVVFVKTDTSAPHPRVAVVIGASRGIGLAVTLALLGDPCLQRVYASYRRAPEAGELSSIEDPRLLRCRLDVSHEADIQELAETIRGNGDQPDLVVHCAGILHETGVQPEKSLGQCEAEAIIRVFQVNSIGPLMLAKALIPLMPRRSAAHFAVLSAMVGSISDNRLGGWYAYRASKAALNQFMRTLSIECRRSHPGLCISAIHPGTTDTALSRPFQGNVKTGKLYTPEQSAARILAVIGASNPEKSGQFVNWDGKPIPA
jgi:NAD(P)-dependent dehydrogenase (short-subunit alcohol dehydrogenase family)